LRNLVGDETGNGVPKQGGCLRMIVLILVQRPRTKRIFRKGQGGARKETMVGVVNPDSWY